MKHPNSFFSIFLGIACLSLNPIAVKAQGFLSQGLNYTVLTSSDSRRNSLIFNAPPLPSGTGRSGNASSGTASRGKCQTKQSVMALVPTDRSAAPAMVWGLTAATHPSLWFYVPDTAPLKAHFTLWKNDKDLVYQTEMVLPEQSGVLRISLPPTEAAIAPDTQYRWYFKVNCSLSELETVSGWIQRVSLPAPVEQQLAQADLAEKTVILARHGIWYDALTTAAQLRQTNPQDSSWATLLRAIGLENWATAPDTSCCQPAP